MSIYFGDTQVIEGSANGFTNAAIEVAIVHCRALFEFIGLAVGPNGKRLREISLQQRKPDDSCIEKFAGLRPVSVAEAVSRYQGSAEEAEAALAYVIYLANKGLAHTSCSFTKHDEGTHLLEIAFRGVPELVCDRYYLAQGLSPPDYKVVGRARPV